MENQGSALVPRALEGGHRVTKPNVEYFELYMSMKAAFVPWRQFSPVQSSAVKRSSSLAILTLPYQYPVFVYVNCKCILHCELFSYIQCMQRQIHGGGIKKDSPFRDFRNPTRRFVFLESLVFISRYSKARHPKDLRIYWKAAHIYTTFINGKGKLFTNRGKGNYKRPQKSRNYLSVFVRLYKRVWYGRTYILLITDF